MVPVVGLLLARLVTLPPAAWMPALPVDMSLEINPALVMSTTPVLKTPLDPLPMPVMAPELVSVRASPAPRTPAKPVMVPELVRVRVPDTESMP